MIQVIGSPPHGMFCSNIMYHGCNKDIYLSRPRKPPDKREHIAGTKHADNLLALPSY